MDWSKFTIPFSITDITAGALRTFSSFAPLVWLVVGMGIATYGLSVIIKLFQGESFWDSL